ncbi:MAG: hypothetical protein WKG52_06210 [Variovorax sp.]
MIGKLTIEARIIQQRYCWLTGIRLKKSARHAPDRCTREPEREHAAQERDACHSCGCIAPGVSSGGEKAHGFYQQHGAEPCTELGTGHMAPADRNQQRRQTGGNEPSDVVVAHEALDQAGADVALALGGDLIAFPRHRVRDGGKPARVLAVRGCMTIVRRRQQLAKKRRARAVGPTFLIHRIPKLSLR